MGSAILGVVASGAATSIEAAMRTMGGAGEVIQPSPAEADYHTAKYAVYRELYDQQLSRRTRMANF